MLVVDIHLMFLVNQQVVINSEKLTLDYIIENIWLQQKIVIVLLLLCLFVGVFRFRKLKKPDRIFVWIVFLAICAELISIYAGFVLRIGDYFPYNILTIISFPLFLLYYKKLEVKFPFYLLLFVFLIGVICSFIFENFFTDFFLICPLFGALTVVISIFYYFSNLMQQKHLEHLFKNSSFLFSCGLMIFYLGIIPYFLLSKYIQLSKTSNQIIIIVLNIILYTFYILAFLCSRRKTY